MTITNISDEEAKILVKAFRNKDKITEADQKNLGDGSVDSIENGICTIKFENGKIEQRRNWLFKTINLLKK